MAKSAEQADERVEQLIALTERLTGLIAIAAQAFEQRRPQDVLKDVEETSRLANLYRHESTRIRADPSLISEAPRQQRTRLVRATEAFDAVLARQGRALDAAKTVTEGLVRAIAEEVAVQRARGSSYGADGVTTKSQSATAITLNQRA